MEGMAVSSLWISWYAHRRSSGLCEAWGIPLKVIPSRHAGLRKWLDQAVETMRLLRRHRPDVLFVQNPSLGLTVLAVWVRWVFGYYLVVDAHNEGVRPFVRSSDFVRRLTRHLLRRADVTIVTNAALAEDVRVAGGNVLILPDSLPTPPPTNAAKDASGAPAPDVMVISTYAPDEPLGAILEAAGRMPEVRFAVSGNAWKFAALGLERPDNVTLTGFLPDRVYWETLARSKVICDLTLMPDCLVCGAYEGLALARPMVLSDNPATRALFGHGAILTRSEAEAIVMALRQALANLPALEESARESREVFRERWQAQAAGVRDAIVHGATDRKPERSEVGA
jgi:glycosyltransferase involved in cell wall biosynthesis